MGLPQVCAALRDRMRQWQFRWWWDICFGLALGRIQGAILCLIIGFGFQSCLMTSQRRKMLQMSTGKSIRGLADKGDLTTITKRINGGLTGLADRQVLYAKALKALS
ncbi:hypothetical protein BOO88_19475 [Stutzerimonas stutzeri]|nr:hypothetical protein BOO88_19475 [Stutzerimonas stutzeri]